MPVHPLALWLQVHFQAMALVQALALALATALDAAALVVVLVAKMAARDVAVLSACMCLQRLRKRTRGPLPWRQQ